MTELPAKLALVQVGETALRGPDGNWLPSTPLYILADPDALVDGLTEGEKNAADELGRLIGDMKHLNAILKGEQNEHQS